MSFELQSRYYIIIKTQNQMKGIQQIDTKNAFLFLLLLIFLKEQRIHILLQLDCKINVLIYTEQT